MYHLLRSAIHPNHLDVANHMCIYYYTVNLTLIALGVESSTWSSR